MFLLIFCWFARECTSQCFQNQRLKLVSLLVTVSQYEIGNYTTRDRKVANWVLTPMLRHEIYPLYISAHSL